MQKKMYQLPTAVNQLQDLIKQLITSLCRAVASNVAILLRVGPAVLSFFIEREDGRDVIVKSLNFLSILNSNNILP